MRMARAPGNAAQRGGRNRRRAREVGDNQLVYRFPKPEPDGSTQLRLTPLELIERLATLVPPSRLHRHHYQACWR